VANAAVQTASAAWPPAGSQSRRRGAIGQRCKSVISVPLPGIPARLTEWCSMAGLLAHGYAPFICLPGITQWHGALRRPRMSGNPLTVAGAATVSAPLSEASPCSLLIPFESPSGNHRGQLNAKPTCRQGRRRRLAGLSGTGMIRHQEVSIRYVITLPLTGRSRVVQMPSRLKALRLALTREAAQSSASMTVSDRLPWHWPKPDLRSCDGASSSRLSGAALPDCHPG
jgi:hypothetical protein